LNNNCIKIPSAFLCELGGEILVSLFDQTGRCFGRRRRCLPCVALKAKRGHLKP
jgi:hypothetical protein